MTGRPLLNLIAMSVAILGVWLLFPVNAPTAFVTWLSRRDYFTTFTPYFPGLNKMEDHEIYSVKNSKKKKIVLLGASAIDSIGCDYTWHRPSSGVEPNVHWSCTVAGQMNQILDEEGHSDWQVFDLARNGTKLTVMLYVYAQIRDLKPDIVVFGDTTGYYVAENADASALNAAQYALMDTVYENDNSTRQLWGAYRNTLIAHGWTAPPKVNAPAFASDALQSTRDRSQATIFEVAVRALGLLRRLSISDGMPRPPAFTSYRDWSKPPESQQPFINPDPGFGYLQGIRLIAEEQQEFGGKTFVYFSPQWDKSNDPAYVAGLDREFGGYLRDHGIPFANFVGMQMKPITETYDGSHHTVLGNHRIAAALLQNLQNDGLVPR